MSNFVKLLVQSKEAVELQVFGIRGWIIAVAIIQDLIIENNKKEKNINTQIYEVHQKPWLLLGSSGEQSYVNDLNCLQNTIYKVITLII